MMTFLAIFLTILGMFGAVGTVQYGGQRMGGVPLVAGGQVTQNFNALPKGAIETIYLTFQFNGISTAAAFPAVVTTGPTGAAEGVDDLDLVINGVFARWNLFWTAADQCGTLTPAQWRTVFGYLNQRDFGGTFVNAVSVPAAGGAATTFQITIPIPVSLIRLFEDGGVFRNGSLRLQEGQIDYVGNASITPTIVLSGGSIVISAPSISLTAETGPGSESDIGPLYRVDRPAGLPTVYDLPPATRLGVLESQPVPTSTVTNWNVNGYALWTPAEFGVQYQSQRLYAGGYDITQRVTPLIWVEQHRKLHEFAPHMNQALHYDAVAGVATVTLYDIKVITPLPSEAERVSIATGGGAGVSIERPTPASLPPGSKVPSFLAPLLPIRFRPGGKTSPALIRDSTVAEKVQSISTVNRSRIFGKG